MFAAKRRMENYRDGSLLFEIEVVRVWNGGEGGRDLDFEGDYLYWFLVLLMFVVR